MIQLPERFKERMQELLGEEYGAFAASYEKERVQGLRFNGLKSAAGRESGWECNAQGEAAVPAARTASVLHSTLEPIPWVKEGYYYEDTARPGKHPLHEAGLYYIQEPSAMAVVELLEPEPGDCVLDLCAAPGGKSSHIASRLKGKGFLLSNEIHAARARILSQNMERMGVVNGVVSNETPAHLAASFPHFFDKIVVDAPCSGEGMFRKDEEAKNQWSEEHVKMCADRQAEILDEAARMLKAGGRMVYSTCTFAPEENEGSILHFLLRHPDFYLEAVKGYEGFYKGQPKWALYGEETGASEAIEEAALADLHLERSFRIMPHKLEGEGHFMAVLRRREDAADGGATKPAIYLDSKKNKELFTGLEQFLKETLEEPQTFFSRKEFILFGEQLYLLPPQMPELKGLKIVRPGLHLGTAKKNRFEPSHALALALLPEEAKIRCELPCDSEECLRYLKGEALSVPPQQLTGGEKGWVLVCTEGYSLGWGKLAGGILKNHYPKGLRWM